MKKSDRTVSVLVSALLMVVLAACQSTPPPPPEKAPQSVGFKRITIRGMGELIGKKIKLDDNYIVLDDNGTFTGAWSGQPMKGVWVFRDNYWCRTLTEFFQTDRVGQDDCQLWEIDGDRLRSTRNKGSGSTFVYTIE